MADTIAAVATAHGIGSIAIIRLSGDGALSIASKLTGKSTFTPRHATLASLNDANGELIDQAIVIYFKGPHSFTGEDIVEFQCHGGQIVAQEALQAVIDAGARLAEPGEFSKRAFHNGRIDLTEAEAIAQLIEAKSEDAARILARQMKGSLREYVESVRDQLLEIMAYSEVTIDYAEEDLPEDLVEQMKVRLERIVSELSRTLQASLSRAGLMQGFKVAIIGKPNVGKSSLLNALLNYNRAIVSDIAGTTRDTIEEQVRIGTHLIRIIDTAGIREAGDEIERIGIERSITAIEESDIVVALFDGSRESDGEDEKIFELLGGYAAQKEMIVALNKSDLPEQFDAAPIERYRPLSLNCKQNVQPLIDALSAIMDTKNLSDEIMLISSRQIEAVKQTLANIEEVVIPLEEQALEIFSFHLIQAVNALASITRHYETDEMLDKMFGSFCLGK